MDITHALLKGVLQGLTEFLPVSSTAHLVFIDTLAKIFHWHAVEVHPAEEEFFDIVLHLGTLVAVIVYFRKELWQMLLGVFGQPLPETNTEENAPRWELKRLPLQMFVTLMVTSVLILGVLKGSEKLFEVMGWTRPHMTDLSEFFLRNPGFVALHLIGTGFLLWFMERKSHAQNTLVAPVLGMKHALWVGVFQGFAGLFHGFSRSGTTISGGVLSGLDRITATRYAFMVSIPTFMAAIVYELLKVTKLNLTGHLHWFEMTLGAIVAAIVGYVCIALFIPFVAKRSLFGFSIYCWVAASAMLVLLQFTGQLF